MLVDLDSKFGYLVGSIFEKYGIWREVESFDEYGSGNWIPKRLHGGSSNESVRIDVVICEINKPIPESQLDASFPEGSMVEEPGKGLIYLWGKGVPSQIVQ